MCRIIFCILMILSLLAAGTPAAPIRLVAKSRNLANGAVELTETRVDPARTAIVIIDMWDRHWCKTYSTRVDNLIPRMNATLAAARTLGIQVVMAPSGVTDFYKDFPQRKSMLAIAQQPTPPLVGFSAPQEGVSSQVCECGPDSPCHTATVQTRQHPGLLIAENDLIGDPNNAHELINLCVARRINTIIYTGIASNMCVSHREFGMLNMRRHGFKVLFVRDLVEAFTANGIDPATLKPDANFTPAKGTYLTEKYLEQYVAPSIESRDVITAAGLGNVDRRPNLVFVIADGDYGSEKTLPAFARSQLEPAVRCTFLNANPNDRNDIPGLDALYDADGVVLSVKRRFLPVAQMDHLERYIRSGRPLTALRVSIVPFAERPGTTRTKEGQVVWQEFDREVLGCKYDFYDPKARQQGSEIWSTSDAKDHPILRGMSKISFHSPVWIYRVNPLQSDTKVLLEGRWDKGLPTQPVAWIRNRPDGGRLFYTSLGHADDFSNPTFIQILRNAINWTLDYDRSTKPNSRADATN